MRARSVTGAVLLAALLTSCTGSGSGAAGAGETAAPAVRPASTGTLTIAEPGAGATVAPAPVPMRVNVTGATVLLDMAVTKVTPDTGHLHIALDGSTLTLMAGTELNLTDLTGGPLTPGPHLLQAEFVAADHGPFNPPVVATAVFTVR